MSFFQAYSTCQFKRLFIFLTALIFVLTTLPGCRFFRLDEAPPEISNTPEVYDGDESYNSTPARNTAHLNKWWKAFKDPQLNLLLEKVLSRNVDLKAAKARLEQGVRRARQASSVLLPSVDLNLQASRSKRSSQTFANVANNFQVSSTISWGIDLFGQLGLQRESLLQQVAALAEDVNASAVNLSGEVVNTYLRVCELRQQISLVERNIKTNATFYNLVLKRYLLGLTPSSDVYQAKSNLMSARAIKPDLDKTLAETEHLLQVFTANYPGKGHFCSHGLFVFKLPGIPTSVPMALVHDRPDLRASFHRLKSADASLASAIANRLPAFTLSAQGGYSSLSEKKIIRPENLIWNVFSGLALPVIDFGNRRQKAQEQRAVYSEVKYNYVKQLLLAFKEVEDALIGEAKIREVVARQINSVDALHRKYQFYSEQYFQGTRSILEVLDAERQVLQGERELIQKKRILASQYVLLAKAVGGGWTPAELGIALEKDIS